jgi:hypothetical protein
MPFAPATHNYRSDVSHRLPLMQLLAAEQRIIHVIAARSTQGAAYMPEPFGKRNRSLVVKAQPTRKRQALGRSPDTNSRATFYVYVIGAVLFIVFAGYALA